MDNSWNDIVNWQTEIKKLDDKLTKSKPLHEKVKHVMVPSKTRLFSKHS
jgi:hypothetical protein